MRGVGEQMERRLREGEPMVADATLRAGTGWVSTEVLGHGDMEPRQNFCQSPGHRFLPEALKVCP